LPWTAGEPPKDCIPVEGVHEQMLVERGRPPKEHRFQPGQSGKSERPPKGKKNNDTNPCSSRSRTVQRKEPG
jgi:hypothetical protein